MSFIQPGDEVILFEPAFTMFVFSFDSILFTSMGCRLTLAQVHLSGQDGWWYHSLCPNTATERQ